MVLPGIHKTTRQLLSCCKTTANESWQMTYSNGTQPAVYTTIDQSIIICCSAGVLQCYHHRVVALANTSKASTTVMQPQTALCIYCSIMPGQTTNPDPPSQTVRIVRYIYKHYRPA